ncbi:MAG: DEAD/DEAH box helicase family protein, partial [Chloroflexota bacterium]|nr:DEAD/DEAH box helicase family protein [Chloroflexota bacterium]
MAEDDLDFGTRLTSFQSDVYDKLRKPQRLALAGFAALVNGEQDLAIELPTGYGKTLVALLIADWALENGERVAYLTGNNHLSDQVLAQAGDLPGFEAVKFSGKKYPPKSLAAYHNAEALGVMNYWVYFNSQPVVEPADLVIFDDAHLAEQPISGLFGVRVDRKRHSEAYDRICGVVAAHTDLYPSVAMMQAGAAGPTTPPELIAFAHWASVQDTVAEVVDQALNDKFTWPLVRQNLSACGLLIGPAAIEIRPYNPPAAVSSGLRASRRRLYLSATLGTMDDLQRRLGVRRIVNVLDSQVEAGVVGDRVFLLNPSTKQPLDDEVLEFALQQAKRAGRTAWLCSSHAEADAVERELSDRTITSYRLRAGSDDALDQWLQSTSGHLVTAGRYDGFDFAGDRCRLVILPSVPAASTEFERFVMAYLGDATFMRHRVGQRVTQALGRANRQEGDWALYLGLSPSFGTLLAQSAVQSAIPSDVRPIIDDALARLSDGWAGARAAAREFWDRSSVERPQPGPEGRRRPGRARPASVSGSAEHEVEAVTRLWLGDHERAASEAHKAAELLLDAGEREHGAFWAYVAAQAEHAGKSPSRAIDALASVTNDAPATAWFVRL